METRIYLLGMPGSGKSTLGRQLAQAWEWGFVDLDTEIAQRTKLTIPEIFARYGEDFFRQAEAAALRDCRAAPLVVATGGGTPCFYDNLNWMNAHGLTVWLDVSLAELNRRLEPTVAPASRPLLGSAAQMEGRLAALYAARTPLYAQAILHTPGDHLTPDELAQRILQGAPTLAKGNLKRNEADTSGGR